MKTKITQKQIAAVNNFKKRMQKLADENGGTISVIMQTNGKAKEIVIAKPKEKQND